MEYSLSEHHQYNPLHPGICFLNQTSRKTITSEGDHIEWKDAGISITVPHKAVPERKQLDLTVQLCLYGPFNMPEGYEPASPVYLITCPFSFSKKVHITLEHFYSLQNEENCKHMAFLSASSTPALQGSNFAYNFKEIQGAKGVFRVGERVATISLKHFCALRIGRKRRHSGQEDSNSVVKRKRGDYN